MAQQSGSSEAKAGAQLHIHMDAFAMLSLAGKHGLQSKENGTSVKSLQHKHSAVSDMFRTVIRAAQVCIRLNVGRLSIKNDDSAYRDTVAYYLIDKVGPSPAIYNFNIS